MNEKMQIVLYGIIADSPALKMALNMVGHTGYHCCYYCELRGVHSREARKRQYPYCESVSQRTCRSFEKNSRRAEEGHCNVLGHLGQSVLEPFIDIPLPHSVLIDFAHVTLLRHFRDVLRTVYASLSPATRKQIDVSLVSQSFPHHFNRKLRGIEDLSFVKAVELKNLFFYAFIPNFIGYLSANQMSFLSLLICGMRLLYGDKVLGDRTSAFANDMIISYYREHEQYFDYHVNFVLHLHEHFASLYDDHGPLSSINTLAFEDFIGYVSKNRNGSRFYHQSLAYYYNVDVYLKNSEQMERECEGKIKLYVFWLLMRQITMVGFDSSPLVLDLYDGSLSSSFSGLFDACDVESIDMSYRPIANYHQRTCSCGNMTNCIRFYRRYAKNGYVFHSLRYVCR